MGQRKSSSNGMTEIISLETWAESNFAMSAVRRDGGSRVGNVNFADNAVRLSNSDIQVTM